MTLNGTERKVDKKSPGQNLGSSIQPKLAEHGPECQNMERVEVLPKYSVEKSVWSTSIGRGEQSELRHKKHAKTGEG